MFESKLNSLVTGVELEQANADIKMAKRVGQYKISASAIYKPDKTYLPVKAVVSVVHDRTAVHVSGCCAGGVPVERLVFATEGGKYPFIFDNNKDINKVLEIIGMEAAE